MGDDTGCVALVEVTHCSHVGWLPSERRGPLLACRGGSLEGLVLEEEEERTTTYEEQYEDDAL